MSQQILRVRPTKIELIRLKRRLALARRIHRILRERLTILVAEFLNSMRILANSRREIMDKLASIYTRISLLNFQHSGDFIKAYIESSPQMIDVYAASKNIMGVKAPFIDVRLREEYKQLKTILSPTTSILLESIRSSSIDIVSKLLDLAEGEKTLEMLGKEILRTRRRVNILEHVVIPRLEATIKYLEMMFDEREREEKTRLKRVKEILKRRRGGE